MFHGFTTVNILTMVFWLQNHAVWQVISNISDEHTAFIFRIQITLNLQAVCLSETSVTMYRTTCCHTPEGTLISILLLKVVYEMSYQQTAQCRLCQTPSYGCLVKLSNISCRVASIQFSCGTLNAHKTVVGKPHERRLLANKTNKWIYGTLLRPGLNQGFVINSLKAISNFFNSRILTVCSEHKMGQDEAPIPLGYEVVSLDGVQYIKTVCWVAKCTSDMAPLTRPQTFFKA